MSYLEGVWESRDPSGPETRGKESSMGMMELIDKVPFTRVTDYIWFTRVLLESGYRPHSLKTPGTNGYATVWAQKGEDVSRVGPGKVARPKWEKGFLVRVGDVIVVAGADSGVITVAR